jgi:hypothetical protein
VDVLVAGGRDVAANVEARLTVSEGQPAPLDSSRLPLGLLGAVSDGQISPVWQW